MNRRSFLHDLAALPFIGGSVALIGRPTAAAVPVTDAVHLRYCAWLAHEYRAAMRERTYDAAMTRWVPGPDRSREVAEDFARAVAHVAMGMPWLPECPDIEAVVSAAPVSSRAAVILSAAGVPLWGGLGRG